MVIFQTSSRTAAFCLRSSPAARDGADSDDPAVVAVAIDGIVRATTRTYRFEDRGVEHTWSLVLPPDSFHAGENEVEIFVVREADGPVLHRTHFSHAVRSICCRMQRRMEWASHTTDSTNAKVLGDSSLRWTNGAATILVPRDGTDEPKSMRVSLATAGPQEKGLLIRVNGCEVFEGKVPAARWTRIFACRNVVTAARQRYIRSGARHIVLQTNESSASPWSASNC